MSEAIIKQEEMSITETQKAAMDLFNPDGKAPEIDQLPAIKIIHAAQLFQMPGNNTIKEFTGRVIEAYQCNAWWEKSFEETGGGQLPDCSSFDGIKPSDPDKAPGKDCATCPLNQFGSDPKGSKGKACKNIRRLFILIDGYGLPLQLTCPPTSLKSFSPYVTDIRAVGWPYQAGVAKFSLEKVETYSVLKIELVGIEKDMDVIKKLVALRDEFMPVMHKQEIVFSEYSGE